MGGRNGNRYNALLNEYYQNLFYFLFQEDSSSEEFSLSIEVLPLALAFCRVSLTTMILKSIPIVSLSIALTGSSYVVIDSFLTVCTRHNAYGAAVVLVS